VTKIGFAVIFKHVYNVEDDIEEDDNVITILEVWNKISISVELRN